MPSLRELNATFFDAGGPGISRQDPVTGELVPAPHRRGVGVLIDCPCGCDELLGIPFANPIDGGPAVEPRGWQRTGETLETLTLRPSIQRVGGCAWHGYITDGQAVRC